MKKPYRNDDAAYRVFIKELSTTLRDSMSAQNLSAEKLEALTGIKSSTVRMIRLGKVGSTLFTCALIFKALGISMDLFMEKVAKRCEEQGIVWPTK